MKNAKTNICLIAQCGLILIISGCQKSENIKTSKTKPEVQLKDSRVQIVHLYSDTVYLLSGVFTRQAGEQLEIDEGTLIKANTGSAGGSIVINPDGLIFANGSEHNPIVFTSNSPPGTQKDNWGGIYIKGKAINNSRGSSGDSSDFSGTLNYVRIEFGSITLDAVGSRSIMKNIMVSYANTIGQNPPSCSFNIFGGSFNGGNLVSYACGGPSDFYLTCGYNGRMQNVLALRHPFFGVTGSGPASSISGVFIENNPSNPRGARPYSFPYISNLTVIGPNGQNGSASSYTDTTLLNGALVTTGSTCFRIRNSVFLGFPVAAWFLGDSLTSYTVQYKQSEFAYSIVSCTDSTKGFYLNPGVYPALLKRGF